MKKFLLALSLLVLVSGSAIAAEVSTNMTVTANVLPAITVTAGSLNFGDIIPGKSGTPPQANVTVTAPSGLGYSIGLGGGNNYSISYGGVRAFSASTGYYELYQDSARTVVWGDPCTAASTTTNGTCVTGLTGTGSAQTHTVYGYDSGISSLGTGAYSDTVAVTVVY